MRIVNDQRVILGPPGCGKTTYLLGRLEAELASGIAPERIAYVSFTRKAVGEAVERAVARFGFKRDQMRYFRTNHSLTFAALGLSKSDVLTVEHLREIGQAIGCEFSTKARVDESTGLIMGGGDGDKHLFLDSLARARCRPLQEQWQEDDQGLDYWAVERTVRAVANYKRSHALFDFTDMLERYVEIGQPLDIDVAFVDEAQDLSTLQWRVLRKMLSQARTVYIAGDDDQAIYRWSGADVETFLSLDGTQTILDRSWRCPPAVHALANRIAGRIGKRFAKAWAPKEGGAGEVITRNDLTTLDFRAMEGSMLLLARNTYLLGEYSKELRQQGLAFTNQYGGSSVNASHARAIYAWEKVRKGQPIPGADVKAIYEQLRVGFGVKRGHKGCKGIDDRRPYSEDELREQFGLLAAGPWFEALDGISLADRMYYRTILRNGGSLVAAPRLMVNTIHGVKGGEADTVIIAPDMAYQTWQGFERAPDDEHRVAYVAVSRARRNLVLLAPRSRMAYPYAAA